MIPGEIFTSFAEFQGIVSVNDFRLPIWLQELLHAPLCFLRSFCFARIRLDPLGGQVLLHDCIPMIVSRFTTFTENFVFCCYQVTKFFSTRYGSTIASPAWNPCNFCPLADLAFSVFWEMSSNTVLTQILTSLEFALWRHFMRRTGVRDSMFRKFHHPPKFLWIPAATPGFQNTTGLSVPSTTGLPFILWFFFHCYWSFIGLINIGSHRSFVNRSWHSHWRGVTLSSILSFSSLSITYCRWWRRAWRRCGTMTPMSWRCPWSWRIRSWRRNCWQAWNHNRIEVLRIANYPNPVFYEMWFLTIDPFVGIPVFIAKLSERQYCWRVFEDFHSQEYIQFVDINSSCVCTSPLTVMTIVGLHDFVKVSISASLKSFLLSICIDAPKSTTNSRSSSLRVWCRQAPIFRKWEECCSFMLL